MTDAPAGLTIGAAIMSFALAQFAALFGLFVWSEIKVIWDVEEELRKLERSLFKIQELVGVIDDCPLRFYGGSNEWQLWFNDMLKLAYDAEALLDETRLQVLHDANQEGKMCLTRVFSKVISFKWTFPRKTSQMQKKLDGVAKEIESIVMTEKLKFHARITMTSGKCKPLSFPSSSSFTSLVGVGRGNDVRGIIDLLGRDSSSSNFSVISVMGMGGIGKTAVARSVYDDVRCDFELRVWVSVSDSVEFDAIRITKSMIEYASAADCHLSDLDSLQLKLQWLLRGKKFLLVLDDYWSEECEDWDSLSWPFQFGGAGSKVIVTTRSKKVSSAVSSSHVHKLKLLSDDDCWEVIKQRSCVSVESSTILESAGRQIAKKCKGMPLAATTLGNMLRCKPAREEEWRLVSRNELWDDERMFLRLMQSYARLPPHLRKCFAYCSIFPQGHEFEMDELALLWVAEGYVNGPQGDQTLEDLARGYFNDLCLRFFFEQCQDGSSSYKMHGLMQGMARLASKDTCFHVGGDLNNSNSLVRDAYHLSLLRDNSGQPVQAPVTRNEKLRTFLLFLMRNHEVPPKTELHPQLFSHLKHLRVLGLGGTGLVELVDSVDQLIYLRYLNLSHNPIHRLPQSIGNLKALHTINVRECPNLPDLPKEMINLINLRHLETDIQQLPPHFGNLTNLQSLSAFNIVCSAQGRGIGELKSMNSLRGSLCITHINDVASANDANEAKIELKARLDKLELQWMIQTRPAEIAIEVLVPGLATEVLGALKPHSNLKGLVIQNYCGTAYPDWLSDSLRSLTSIALKGLTNCDSLPSLGELPSLESFVITDMPSLESVDHKLYGTSNAVQKFPSLTHFELRGLSRLTSWEVDDESYPNAMPHLKEFTIHDCTLLSSLPPNIQQLLPDSNIANCPRLIISA